MFWRKKQTQQQMPGATVAKLETYTTNHVRGVSGKYRLKVDDNVAHIYEAAGASFGVSSLTLAQRDFDDLLELVTALRKHWRPNTSRLVCARDEGHAMCPRCNHCQKCWDAHFGPACPS